MRLIYLLASVLCAGSLVARADTVTVFNVNASFDPLYNPGTITGTLTIDTTTGVVNSGNLTANVGGNTYLYNESASIQGTNVHYFVDFNNGIASQLQIFFPQSSLVGYVGGVVCNDTPNCPVVGALGSYYGTDLVDFAMNRGYAVSSGSVAPMSAAAVTPEPSSLLLLGTGLLGTIGVMRKRFA